MNRRAEQIGQPPAQGERLNYSTPELRRLWRAYWAAIDAHHAAWEAQRAREHQAHLDATLAAIRRGRSRPALVYAPPPAAPPFPRELLDLRCGARTKQRGGAPCKRKDLYHSGRCKFHGGLSTGPRTKLGKARSARNGLWRRRTEVHELFGNPRIMGRPTGPRAPGTTKPHESLIKADIPGSRRPGRGHHSPHKKRRTADEH